MTWLQMLYDLGLLFVSTVIALTIAVVAGIAIARWLEFQATRRWIMAVITEMASPVSEFDEAKLSAALGVQLNRCSERLRIEGVLQFKLQGHEAAAEATEMIRTLIAKGLSPTDHGEMNFEIQPTPTGAKCIIPFPQEVHSEVMNKAQAIYPSIPALFRFKRAILPPHSGRISLEQTRRGRSRDERAEVETEP